MLPHQALAIPVLYLVMSVIFYGYEDHLTQGPSFRDGLNPWNQLQ